jgi:hypothetical protein
MGTSSGSADPVDPSVSVLIRNGFFSWGALGKERHHALKHINLKVFKGQLVMIVGEVSTIFLGQCLTSTPIKIVMLQRINHRLDVGNLPSSSHS